MQNMEDLRAAAEFYAAHYAMIEPLFLRPNKKIVLGNKYNRMCRFCQLGEPLVTFKQVAHAIPESLGNKGFTTNYECDSCNHAFGLGIENDLGNWSKPNRTFARIRGKNGVPTLTKSSRGGWRIKYGRSGFVISQYEDDPILVVDEAKNQVRFELKRDPYTPVAVFKAFVKIALTILPPEEIANFTEAFEWICEPDHTRVLMRKAPIIHTFQPGPMPPDLIVVWLLRRRPSVTGTPYAFLVLAYGNDVFQVAIPSPKRDQAINGQDLQLPAFPTPGGPDPAKYGAKQCAVLDLTSNQIVRGETVPIVLGFDSILRV